MIDIQTVINKLKAETGYSVKPAKGSDLELREFDSPISLSVGYGPILSENPDKNIAYDIYQQNAENVIQSFYIELCCQPEKFSLVFRDVYTALIGWNPNTDEALHTSFTFAGGIPVGFNNTMFIFREEWKIGFPTNQLL